MGREVRLGEERKEEPPEKKQRLTGEHGVRKDSFNGVKRPNREGCFVCMSTDHMARDCPDATEWGGNRLIGGGRGRGGDRGGRGNGYGRYGGASRAMH